MRPALLNPLFAPVTSLGGVGPKQDRLLRYLLDRDQTPRLVDLLLHLPASVIDRRARPKIRDAVPGTVVMLEVTVDRHRPTPARNSRAPHLVYASDETGDVVLTYFRAQPGYVEKLLPVGSKRYVSGTAQMYDGTLTASSMRPVSQNCRASIRFIRSRRDWRSDRCGARWRRRCKNCRRFPSGSVPRCCVAASFRRSPKRSTACTCRSS
jgi:RecG-like helicase